MLEIDGLVSLAALGLWIFCIIDVITTDASLTRNLEKTWWIVIVLLFSVVGSIIWLVAGRPQRSTQGLSGRVSGAASRAPTSSRDHHVAPDDDPEFLAGVRMQNKEDTALLKSWEEDLRKREEDLRRGEHGPGPLPQP